MRTVLSLSAVLAGTLLWLFALSALLSFVWAPTVTGKSQLWLHVGSVSFTLTFDSRLLLFTKRIRSIHNGLPQGALPFCLNVKPKCLCSGKHLDPVHLWMATKKKKLTHPLPEAGHSGGYLQNLWSFYLTSSSPLHLCAIKETGIQTLVRWLFRDISLPSSQSASFPNKVVFLASTPHLQFIGLLCGEQSELGLGNTTSAGMSPQGSETVHQQLQAYILLESQVKSESVLQLVQ